MTHTQRRRHIAYRRPYRTRVWEAQERRARHRDRQGGKEQCCATPRSVWKRVLKRGFHETTGPSLTVAAPRRRMPLADLQAATTAARSAARAVGWDGGDILNAANLQASACEGTKRRLGPGARRLGAVASGCAHLDVQAADAKLFALGSNILRGKHS